MPIPPMNRAMRLTAVLVAALVSLVALNAVAHHAAHHDEPTEPAETAWSMVDDGALLLDVRSPEEFESGHLSGALRVDFDDPEALRQAIGEDRDRPVVLYCRSGGRAGKAIAALEAEGYQALFNGTGYEDLAAARPDLAVVPPDHESDSSCRGSC